MLPQQLLETEIFLNKKDDSKVYLSDRIVQVVRDNIKARREAIDRVLGAMYDENTPSLHGGSPGQADAIGKIAVTSHAKPLTPVPVATIRLLFLNSTAFAEILLPKFKYPTSVRVMV